MKKLLVLIVVIVLIFASCTGAPKESTDTSINVSEEKATKEVTSEPTQEPTEEVTEESSEDSEMSRMVAIVLPMDRYATAELDPVIAAVITAGYDFAMVSSEVGLAQGTEDGTEIKNTFSEYSPEDLRGIIVIGGSDSLWENEEIKSLIKGMHEIDRVTAGICLSSIVLAKAGVIDEGESACWFNSDISDPEMEAIGVLDSGQMVTVNGNVITGNGPDAATEFAEEVAKALDALG